MPARAIKNKFTDEMAAGGKAPFGCRYKCLRTCDPLSAPYCIAKALGKASQGDIDNAIIFAGSNVFRVKKIVPVKELMDELIKEASQEILSIKTSA